MAPRLFLPPPKLHLPLAPNVMITSQGTNQTIAAECTIAMSPVSNNVVCALRQVSGPDHQLAQLNAAIFYSTDSGKTWEPSAPLSLNAPNFGEPFGANANPSVAFDEDGNAYLLTLAVTSNLQHLVGIAIYKSIDGGVTWSNPHLLRQNGFDDKPSIFIDTKNGKYPGRIYGMWLSFEADANGQNEQVVVLGRSNDAGATWNIKTISTTASWPTGALSPDGVFYFARSIGAQAFSVGRSDDGGETFSYFKVTGIDLLQTSGATVMIGDVIESADTFGNALFRANSFTSICAGSDGLLLCAWLKPTYDDQNNLVKIGIRFLRSRDGGEIWDQPRIEKNYWEKYSLSHGNIEDTCLFSPQLAVTPSGKIVCNYYSYTPSSSTANWGWISVHASVSSDGGESFSDSYQISDQAWITDAGQTMMVKLGSSDYTLIGDYFGLATGPISGSAEEGFISAWTDGRSGAEQIVCSMVTPIP